jgi:hypothetical protein
VQRLGRVQPTCFPQLCWQASEFKIISYSFKGCTYLLTKLFIQIVSFFENFCLGCGPYGQAAPRFMYVFKYALTMNAKSRKNCVFIETKLEAIKNFIKGEIIKNLALDYVYEK